MGSSPDIVALDISQDDIDRAWNHREKRQKDQPHYNAAYCCAAVLAAERVFDTTLGRLAVAGGRVMSGGVTLGRSVDEGALSEFTTSFDSSGNNILNTPRPQKILLTLTSSGQKRLKGATK